MTKRISSWERIALIGAMSERAPKGSLNRTAIMKCTYFLQTLRQVPLGYSFTLYSYGPYDKDVLDDLDYAETLGVVDAERVEYRGGYGYKIRAGAKVEKVKECASEFLSRREADIHWVLSEFGSLTSADLELASTIIYADREAQQGSQGLEELARRVGEVKPHFNPIQILTRAKSLQTKGLLQSIRSAN
ncbi:MAG: hypothetical protein ACLQNE_30745 [Thermoguttaceae bacterium]|jgi:uncharacterized protein YwgA